MSKTYDPVKRKAENDAYRERVLRETGKTPWQISEENRRAKGVTRKRTIYKKTCTYEACGAAYDTTDNSSKFCSRECFGKANRSERFDPNRVRKPRSYYKTSRRFREASRKAAHAALGSSSRWVFVQGDCHWCGESFTARTNMGDARFCSSRCKTKSKMKRRGKFILTDAERVALYQRDGYICQICFTATAPDADPLDPRFPTADHVVPQCDFEEDDPMRDAPANLRTAHRLCNSMRSDGKWLTDEEVRVRALSVFSSYPGE